MTNKETLDDMEFTTNRVLKMLAVALDINPADLKQSMILLGAPKANIKFWLCSPKNKDYQKLPDKKLFKWIDLMFKKPSNGVLIRLLCREIQLSEITDKEASEAMKVLKKIYTK